MKKMMMERHKKNIKWAEKIVLKKYNYLSFTRQQWKKKKIKEILAEKKSDFR